MPASAPGLIRSIFGGIVCAAVAVVSTSAVRAGPTGGPSSTALAAATAPAAPAASVAELIFDGGLKGQWQDWGWAPRSVQAGQPAALHMGKYAGWILAHRGLTGSFSALSFDVKAPAEFGDFLEVYLTSEGDDSFKHVPITAAMGAAVPGGFRRIRLEMAELNPNASPFDRVVFHATKAVGEAPVALDKIFLLAGSAVAPVPVEPSQLPSHVAHLQVDCRSPSHAISPLIYGTAFNPQRVGKDPWVWETGTTARRWGGNNTSRYNWRLGNAWNCASDYFYLNANYTNNDHYTWKDFLEEDSAHHVATALTIPMLGWVAKDTDSASYPTSVFGEQQYSAGDNGNGKRSGGGLIDGADPKRTSTQASPAFMRDWIRAIRAYDAEHGGRAVTHYILDNEPALWNSTHRDVHPKALTYDELLQRTVEYATVIRQEDPQALIAGPAEWGWPAYFYSAHDAEVGFKVKPDRRAHGDVPLLNWYLQKLRAHELKTGQRLLDIVDLHFYPQEDGVYGHPDRTDPQAAALRLRATRSLWDPTYLDESWINERIALLPRLKQIIAETYPGLKISLGEYNFGGERHISGGLAQAEALGRFGQAGVYSAYYWTYPPQGSPAYTAFRTYRNYDGHGAHFLDHSLRSSGDARTSVFASQDAGGHKMVLVVLNLDPHEVADVELRLGGCGAWRSGRTFSYSGGPQGLVQAPHPAVVQANTLRHKILPSSINVFELQK
jgi:hypothetical protein